MLRSSVLLSLKNPKYKNRLIFTNTEWVNQFIYSKHHVLIDEQEKSLNCIAGFDVDGGVYWNWML